VLTSLKLVRGLRNEDGQYNCFLNVIIQALWHLRSFRQRLLQLQAPAAAAAAAGAANGPTGPPAALSADIQVLRALRAVFQDLSKAANASLPAAADTPAAAVAAEQGQIKAGSGSRSSASSSGGSEWLVCPAVLREALARLDLGAAAISIELSEMHDASEVLNEVFTALHHAEAGRAAAVADDPQLPTKVKVRPELFSKKGPQQQPQQQQQQPQLQAQQPQTLAHKLQQQQQANGVGSAAGMNGVAGGAKTAGGASGVLHKAPKSLVHALFGLDVLQAIAPGDGSSSKKAVASSAAAGAASGTKDAGGVLVEAQQFMQFFHLVPAQVGLCESLWAGLWCFASTAGSVAAPQRLRHVG
jgi:hypothetical protein